VADDRLDDTSISDPSSPPPVDTRTPHSARVWNYWLGGKDNYAADRAAGDAVLAAFPAIVDTARQSRRFLRRAVHTLVTEHGIGQFLDIGTGLPTANNTHEVAQSLDPAARIVYVDKDPLVLTHARALLTSTPEGACAYVDADLADPAAIIAAAGGTLDLGEPVGLMLIAILHHIIDDTQAAEVMAYLKDAIAPGSFVAIVHVTADFHGDVVRQAITAFNAKTPTPLVPRTREQVAAYFDGLEFLDPGLVTTSRWRPDTKSPVGAAEPAEVPQWAAVARKP
jgi:S-adenosyl methyltransferase